MGKRLILEITVVALLGIAAIAGWVRKPAAPAAGVENAPLPVPQFTQPSPQPAVPRTYASVPVKRGRSTKKSVAIVAGSAGVGAAVGALAGGGKGAAIGALAGGGAGLVYDRLTHKTHSGL